MLDLVNEDIAAAFFFALGAFTHSAMVARAHARAAQERAEELLAQLRASQAAQRAAVALGERTRLAREVHDILAHSLAGLVLTLDTAELIGRRADADPQAVTKLLEQVARAQRIARDGLADTRGAISADRDARAGRAARRPADGRADGRGLPCTPVAAHQSRPPPGGGNVSEAAELRGRYPIRILIVDDQKVVREGLVALVGLLPGITVVGAAADGEDAVRQALDLRPDVVLMDLNLPRSNGVEATERLRDLQPDTDAALFVSEATVKTHVNHIFGKTRLHDRAKLVSYAFRNGLAGPG